MTVLPTAFVTNELEIVGVYDRGVPNNERIALLAHSTVELGAYGLMIGVRGSLGDAFPIRDNLFWFGNGALNPGDWLLVYTGNGRSTVGSVANTSARFVTVHWGRMRTMFNSHETVPILFRVDHVQVPQEQHWYPQQG